VPLANSTFTQTVGCLVTENIMLEQKCILK